MEGELVYVPFIKAKQNEIRAIGLLDKEVFNKCYFFLDLPRESDLTEELFRKKVATAKKELGKVKKLTEKGFYLDSYDIPDELKPDGMSAYEYSLRELLDFNIIPVTGLDRSPEHELSIFNVLNNCPKIAVRLVDDDLLSARLTADALQELHDYYGNDVQFDVIVDWRLVDKESVSLILEKSGALIDKLTNMDFVDRIILSSSSIPSFIGEIVDAKKHTSFARLEFELQKLISSRYKGKAIYGDYTVVSPDYSDANIPREYMRSRQTPRAIYSGVENSYVVRGGGLSRYGDNQFFEMAEKVLGCGHFRRGESQGDNYIENVALKRLTKKVSGVVIPKCGNASKWIEATVNSHITFLTKLVSS